jgi:hypothetical protein
MPWWLWLLVGALVGGLCTYIWLVWLFRDVLR